MCVQGVCGHPGGAQRVRGLVLPSLPAAEAAGPEQEEGEEDQEEVKKLGGNNKK